MITIANNGSKLAYDLHELGQLKDGLTLEEIEQIAIDLNDIPDRVRFLRSDDFWEDFLYTADELGYKLKC